MNRFIIAGFITLPIAWLLLAYAQIAPWPQLVFGASSSSNIGITAGVMILAVALVLSVRFRVSNTRDDLAGWSSDIGLIALALVGIFGAGLSGFWTLDNTTIALLGQELAQGGNPYNDAEQFKPIASLFLSATVFHWLPISENVANAVWAALVTISVLSGAIIAIWGTSGQNRHGLRALIFVASPILVLWGVSNTHPWLLTYPFVIMAILFSSRGHAVASAIALVLAAGFHPIYLALVPALLLPGSTANVGKRIGLPACLRAFTALIVLGGVLYAPLFASMAQGGLQAASLWPQVGNALPMLGAVQDNFWIFSGAIFVIGASIAVSAIALQAINNARKQDKPGVFIDYRSRACVVILMIAILLFPQVPGLAVLLVLPLLARTPNLAFSLGAIALTLAQFGSVGVDVPMVPASLALPLVCIIAITLGALIEAGLSHLNRQTMQPSNSNSHSSTPIGAEA